MEKRYWFIDGYEDHFDTLKQAKDHLLYSYTAEELKKDFNGFIYHVVNGESVGGVPFECINKKFRFHKSVREPF